MNQPADPSRDASGAESPQDPFADHGSQPATGVPRPAATAYADARDSVGRQPKPRSRRALATVALTTGLVVGGAAVAAAVSGTAPSSSTGGPVGAVSQPGAAGDLGAAPLLGAHGDGRPGSPGGRVGGVGGALHGELTVPQADGTGTRVVLVQSGAVTAVSSGRLSVRSTDGFTATYPVDTATQVRTPDGTTIAGVKVGDTVSVVAAKGGAALRVVERGAHGKGPDGQGPDGHGSAGQGRNGRGDRDGRGAPALTPSSTPSATATGASA